MTNLTNLLDNEAGIQYQGVTDASSSTGTFPIIGLIVGEFKCGRTDIPMTINSGNIKTLLGDDPENPHYAIVQDALDNGVPSVQVLRVISGGEAGGGGGGGGGQPEVIKPMIISGLLFSSAQIYCKTQLVFEWLEGTGTVTEQWVETEGDSFYRYLPQANEGGYGGVENGGDSSRISIMPADGVSKLQEFGMQYVYRIEQWWSGGYDKFKEMGMYLSKAPLIEPKNTTNFDILFSGSTYFNSDLTGWDMRKATTASRMLAGIAGTVGDLSKWCVPLLNTEASHAQFGFGSTSFYSYPEYLPVWGTCPLG